MFEISVMMGFSAAHKLREYRGKCEKLHGHNWQVEAVFGVRQLNKSGMVMDFTAAKKLLKAAVKDFDHRYINELRYFKKVNPTSENIARFIFQKLIKKAKTRTCTVLRVSVWETPGSRATYYE